MCVGYRRSKVSRKFRVWNVHFEGSLVLVSLVLIS